MATSSFTRMATTDCSTKRPPALAGGKRGAAAAYLNNLHCVPLMPVDPELRLRLALPATAELLQTMLQGSPDIREGDTLVIGADEYQVRAVADWPWPADSSTYRLLVLEQPMPGKY